MKKFLIITSLFTVAILGCEKNSGYIDPSLDATGARVKFIHASWNAPALMFYGKDTTIKFSAGTPTTTGILTGIGYGSTYPSNDYSLMGAYADSLKVRVPANSTTFPGLFKGIGTINIQDNKKYSVFVVDSFPDVSALVLEDNVKEFNTIPDSFYNARFVNVVYGSPAYDVFSKRNNAVIASNIGYKQSTDFIQLKVWPVTDTLELRVAGSSTFIARLVNFTAGNQRTYTWFARGRHGSTTAAPTLSFYTNQ